MKFLELAFGEHVPTLPLQDASRRPDSASGECTGRLGLGAFLELFLHYGSFSFLSIVLPSHRYAHRWAAEVRSKGGSYNGPES
jgi:hypothetical protein